MAPRCSEQVLKRRGWDVRAGIGVLNAPTCPYGTPEPGTSFQSAVR